jgi:hypothetical protein
VNADGGQGIANFFELEWLDDRHNDFHGSYSPLGLGTRTERSRLKFTTQKVTTRVQPKAVESNAVPVRPAPETFL